MLNRDRGGVYEYSERFRASRESQKLWDLGCTIEEKYSPARGWNHTLRNHYEENVGRRNSTGTNTEDGKVRDRDMFEDRQPAGPDGSGFATIRRENRA